VSRKLVGERHFCPAHRPYQENECDADQVFECVLVGYESEIGMDVAQRSEAYLCDYVRTPIGRFGGALSGVRADDLGAVPLRALMGRNGRVDWAAIDDVIFGCANQAGEDNRNVARMSLLLAGLPKEVTGSTINRLCGSGMDAVLTAARAIRAGEAELVIAGGVESMSRAPFVLPKADAAFSRNAEIHDTTIGWRFVNPLMEKAHGVDSMPETAENVAEEFQVSRADQDAFAVRSQDRAVAAQRNGRFAKEITPVAVPQRRGDPAIVDKDEHPRPGTTAEMLAKLPTPFRPGGSVTAGNASGVNDGAAALIVASERAANAHGLTPIARILGGATAGVAPRIMGMGPAPATEKLCRRLGLRPADFDIIELNEAFASQGIAVLRQLGIREDAEHVNPNGGAIALGHPLGMSGARITGTAALELRERGAKRALATMCIGVGQGIAVALERA
jgi:acetyl-CoA acyltransferase